MSFSRMKPFQGWNHWETNGKAMRRFGIYWQPSKLSGILQRNQSPSIHWQTRLAVISWCPQSSQWRAMLLKYSWCSILISPDLLDGPRCPQCLPDAFDALQCRNLQFIRACAGGFLYGSVERFSSVCNAWLFDTPNDGPWAIASHGFSKPLNIPLWFVRPADVAIALRRFQQNSNGLRMFPWPAWDRSDIFETFGRPPKSSQT